MRGFTLMELLVAITIISIIFGVIITSSASIQKNSRDAQRKSDLTALQNGLQQYFADSQNFPVTIPAPGNPLRSADNTKTYMRKIPADPTTGTAYRYQSLTLSGATTCDNTSGSTTPCLNYCLYAKLEIDPNPAETYSSCPADSGFNLQMTQP